MSKAKEMNSKDIKEAEDALSAMADDITDSMSNDELQDIILKQEEPTTSRGWFFDQINSIANDLALVNHLQEAHYATMRDLEEAVGDEEALMLSELLQNYEELIKLTLDNRRSKMKYLQSIAEDYNPRMWCPIKHAIESYMESMEVYHATFSDKALMQFKNSMDILAGVVSLFLGIEFKTCQRCLADELNNLK